MQKQTNPFAYNKPITLDTLGDLFAHHHRLTSGWSMEGDSGGGDAGAGSGDGGSGSGYSPPASQADLDRIIGERVARERGKYADYDDLKAKAVAHDEAINAAKTDAEKAVEAARKEGETTATERANARLIQAEARAEAATANFRNPAAAVRLLDLADVKVNDDGTIDAAALKAKLTALATSDPYLVDDGKKTPRPDHSQGGGGSGPDVPSVSRGQQMWEARHGKKTNA